MKKVLDTGYRIERAIYFNHRGTEDTEKMAKTTTSWSKGKSGNPKGRPKGKRSLTELLRKAGERMVYDDVGRLLPANETVANLVWDLMVRGQVSLGGNVYVMRSVDEWLDGVKWLYTHMDGDAALEAAMTQGTNKQQNTERDGDHDETDDGPGDETDAEIQASQRLSAEYPGLQRIEVVDPMTELKQLQQVPGGLDESEDYDRLRRLRRRGRQR